MATRVIVLGSTGSVGQNCLRVVAGLAPDYEIVGLGAGSRWEELVGQARYWRPKCLAIADPANADALRTAAPPGATVLAGADALARMVEETECDCVVSAMVGAAGLAPLLSAVERGLRVAIANKEAMVVAGGLLWSMAERTGATLLPVDSEHSAIFQAMQAGRRAEVKRVFLTASGGPFRTWTAEAMTAATVDEALQHPTWDMGPKISIDSATMMNKALEIVEARWFFGLRADQIEVVVHPESIIHSLVEYCDGSMIAQLGVPDMRGPIQYALTYPERRPSPCEPLDLHALRLLTFEAPNAERFPALGLGREVAERGGTAGAVLNAANEAAVSLFRDSAVRFTDITDLTRRALDNHDFIENPTLDDLLRADAWARSEVQRCLTS